MKEHVKQESAWGKEPWRLNLTPMLDKELDI